MRKVWGVPNQLINEGLLLLANYDASLFPKRNRYEDIKRIKDTVSRLPKFVDVASEHRTMAA